MAEAAMGMCNNPSSSFLHKQAAFSSSESLFSTFPICNFGKRGQNSHRHLKKLFIRRTQHQSIRATASTLSSPAKTKKYDGAYPVPRDRDRRSSSEDSTTFSSSLASRQRPAARPTKAKPERRRLMKKGGAPPPSRHSRTLLGVRDAILRPPLDDKRLADKFLRSPQMSLKTLPLLSSCLPYSPLHAQDEEWMEQFMPEIKEALGYPLPGMDKPTSPDVPLYHLDTLLYAAFQHSESFRGNQKYLRVAHSRLAFLGEYILDLALVEYFLVRYPRETPACMRERIFGLTNKTMLPGWLESASLDRCIYPEGRRGSKNLANYRGVFWALVATLYLCMGMSEVYRLLFEVFGLDPDAAFCQPKRRLGRLDVDYVYAPLDEKQMDWTELSSLKTADDDVFAKPLLYRACVPPGMQRFRGNLWEIDSLPQVLQILGYPLTTIGEDPEVVKTRNLELELGLQLCFLHPSVYKMEHPRFCNERFEYLGSKIQDVVMAEKLIMKHLDAPGFYIKEKHRRLLFNRLCGKYFREKKLQKFMILNDARKELFDKSRKLKNFATTGCSLALHGLGYAVYGRAEVRRIMFEFLDFERLQMASSYEPPSSKL
ncbi:hypothetical protein KP509_37G005400 [Ceratopteris richardii]|uniref:RNase III domain-containing protein n=1 Tax=Ceratopteris richardii TaxID=49495 RepID=A0A8T2Q626_CERRI|nr:hypothetical protein KP509_37G005400 [Ceratopteris richardii]